MKKLSKEEMKRVLGGVYEGDKGDSNGCCCAHHHGWYLCGMSMNDAKDKANEYAQQYGEGKWCCKSCAISNPCIP